MEISNGISLVPLKESDIEELTPIMKRAFDEDSRIHLGKESGGPPGYDNGEFLREYGLNEKSTAFKILLEGQTIGAVILWINQETQHNYLGNLFIDSTIQNKNVGKQVWDYIENYYSNTVCWHTETPIFSMRNHHFYINKCGFRAVKIENPKNMEEGSFVLEKYMQ